MFTFAMVPVTRGRKHAEGHIACACLKRTLGAQQDVSEACTAIPQAAPHMLAKLQKIASKVGQRPSCPIWSAVLLGYAGIDTF